MYMAKVIKCSFCGDYVAKEPSAEENGKYYHSFCLAEKHSRDEIIKLLCSLFSLKKPNNRMFEQIKFYTSSACGFTYTGILNSLNYFYLILGNDISKSNDGIGIVPYVYEAAQRHFAAVDRRKENFKNLAENQTNTPKISVPATVENKRERKLIDLTKI